MIAQWIKNTPFCQADWQQSMPGVSTCRFSFSAKEPSASFQKHTSPYFEVLFCQTGRVSFSGAEKYLQLPSRRILLLSQENTVEEAIFSSDFTGVLICAQASMIQENIRQLYAFLGFPPPDIHSVKTSLHKLGGAAIIPPSPWVEPFFQQLSSLSPSRQPSYCLWKSAEILYLLGSKSFSISQSSAGILPGGYLGNTIDRICQYLEEHLEEKNTIQTLSNKFCISSTSLKAAFRQKTGVSIHRWILEKRMQRAAYLLQNTDCSILQISQAVGYEGSSQFAQQFKRRYGVSPKQYTKMSDSSVF